MSTRTYSHPREAAYAVLYGARKPLHRDDILSEAIQRGLMAGPADKKTAGQISNKINAEIRGEGCQGDLAQCRFVRTNPNTFALKDYAIYKGLAIRDIPQPASVSVVSGSGQQHRPPDHSQPFGQPPAVFNVAPPPPPVRDPTVVASKTLPNGERIVLKRRTDSVLDSQPARDTSIATAHCTEPQRTLGATTHRAVSQEAPPPAVIVGSFVQSASKSTRPHKAAPHEAAPSKVAPHKSTQRDQILDKIASACEPHVGRAKAVAWTQRLREKRGDSLLRVVEKAERITAMT